MNVHQPVPAVRPLQYLLDYLSETIRLGGRAIERLSELQLVGGHAFVVHQQELENLPGVVFNTFDADGPIWLAIESLAATEPPSVDADLLIWIELSSDPDQRPTIRDSVQITVDRLAKNRMIAARQARAEDFVPAIAHDVSAGVWSVRLHLAQSPDLAERIDRYIGGPWNAWAAAERARQRTIAIHRRLHEMARVAGPGGSDRSCEIVWGVGLSRWRHHGHDLELPLLECLVEIEILGGPDADIRIRPRMVGAAVNLAAFEASAPGPVHLARDSAESLLDTIERGGEFSPFLPASFEPVLGAISSQLDPQGIYRAPGSEAVSPLPEAGDRLVVSDRWVIFARPRSDDLVLRDIERLKQAIEEAPESECCLSGVASVLLSPPNHDAKAGARRQLSGIIGYPIDIATAAPVADAHHADPFFPLLASKDQIEMLRQLERSDGLVVLGARGTERLSAIANIICHHLALGLRVLVVSRNDAALTFLHEKLPLAIRDLTLNLTGSDKDVLRHAETVVSRLQSIVESLDPRDKVDEINELERDIIVTRREISHLDDEVADIAGRHLQKQPGLSDLQVDMVKLLASDCAAYFWFTDRPTRVLSGTDPIVAAVDMAREARLRLAGELQYIDEEPPEIAGLPDAETLMRLHEDLRRTAEPFSGENRDGKLGRDAVAVLGLEGADNLAADLDALLSAHRVISDQPWLAALSPLGANADEISTDVGTVIEFARDVSSQLSRRAGFLARPVETPPDAFAHKELIDLVDRLSVGGKAFSKFSRSRRALKTAIEAIRVAGFAPSVPGDWAHVRDYLAWRRDLHSLGARWRSLAAEIGAPIAEPESPHPFQGIERIAKCVEVAIVTAALAKRNLAAVGPKLAILSGEIDTMLADVRRLAAFGAAVKSAVSRVANQRLELTRLNELFSGNGALASLVRTEVLSQIGRDEVELREIEKRWSSIRGLIKSLHDRRGDFARIDSLCRLITEAGAPAFARRIRTEPVQRGAGDAVLVADWATAWNWAALMRQTEGPGQHQRLRVLIDQRAALETRLQGLFEAAIAARMHLGFAQNSSSAVRQALTVFMITLRKMATTCSGPTASRLRLVAREALQRCHDGIPCEIMPAWRIAEQLAARIGAFDLVVIDDASQSDLRDLTAMLRGRKVLVTDEDQQTGTKVVDLGDHTIERVEHDLLRSVPAAVRQLLLPGTSLCDLVKILFPDRMIRLSEQVNRAGASALPAPALLAQPAELRAPLFGEPLPDWTRGGAPYERASPTGGPTRPMALEEEIATAAESLSLARRTRAECATEPASVTDDLPPEWLSSAASGDLRGAEADTARRRARADRVAASLELSEPAEVIVLSEQASPPEKADRRRNVGDIILPPFSASGRPAASEFSMQGRRPLRWHAIAVAAAAALAMIAATAYRQRDLIRLPFALSGSAPTSALLEKIEPRKIAAERIAPEGKTAAAGDDRGAIGGSKSETVLSQASLILEEPTDPYGKRYFGTVRWHVEHNTVSTATSTIKGEVSIDQRMSATLSLRRNTDAELPASHVLEVRFNGKDDAIHGSVDTLKALRMKTYEMEVGSSVLTTQIAKVAPNFFLIALSTADVVDMKVNLQLLKNKPWFDLPIVYDGGNRAILSIEKGADGERAFKDAFAAWGQ